MPLPLGITIQRPCIIGCSEVFQQKASMCSHMTVVVLTESTTPQNWETKQAYNSHNNGGSTALKKPIRPKDVLCFKYGNKNYIKKEYTLPQKKKNCV